MQWEEVEDILEELVLWNEETKVFGLYFLLQKEILSM
jgi:hypothetical protein